jgi:two-component SAPR family response regulator
VEREEFWQAGNQFHNALTLWKGSLPSDTFRNDSIYAIEDSLLTTYEKMSLSWAEILADAERYNEAIPILTGMLQVNGLSEKGVLLLCNFYTATNQPLKIRETLDRYKKALQAMEYHKDEIGTMIDDITNRLGQTKRNSVN